MHVQDTEVIDEKKKCLEPSKYAISIRRGNFSRGNIIIWEDFSNEMARIFCLGNRTMYILLKNSIVNGIEVSFGAYTKDVAETMVAMAESICEKHKPVILPVFKVIKI